MRTRPESEAHEARPEAVVPLREGFKKVPGLRDQRPTDQGDRIRPWLVSGGQATWFGLPYVEPAELAGVQLLASFYVPEAMTGFVKQIKAGPFKPSVLYSSVSNQLVPNVGAVAASDNNPDGDNGYWRTPFAWEGYTSDAGVNPFWQWHLRMVRGDIAAIREGKNIPAFSFLDPLSWFLVPNLPVPASGYPNGIPGTPPGMGWGPQRMQRFGGWEEGEVHIPIPGDTTVCLFAEWTQDIYTAVFQATDGAGTTILPNFILALGPSFGQLEGYTQPDNTVAGQRSAREGWQS